MNKPISASLMRRLAEAADGYRTGNPVYIIAEIKPPHEIMLVSDENSIKEMFASLNSDEYDIFGPFITKENKQFSEFGEVFEVQVKIKKGSDIKIISIDPKETDSLFWSLSAIEKFVFPYYTLIYGPDYVAKLRKQLLSGQTKVLGHIRSTKWIPTHDPD